MSETAPYTPPEWPRFLFKHGEAPRQFQSQEEADQAGGGWHRTQEEADQAQQQASQARPQSPPPAPPPQAPPPPEDEGESSPGEDRPHTSRRR
jgi:hypothetical protein